MSSVYFFESLFFLVRLYPWTLFSTAQSPRADGVATQNNSCAFCVIRKEGVGLLRGGVPTVRLIPPVGRQERFLFFCQFSTEM